MAFVKKLFSRSQSMRDFETTVDPVTADPSPRNWKYRPSPLVNISSSSNATTPEHSPTDTPISDSRRRRTAPSQYLLNFSRTSQPVIQEQSTSGSFSSSSRSRSSIKRVWNIERVIMHEFLFDQVFLHKAGHRITAVMHLCAGFILTAAEDGNVALWNVVKGQFCGTRQIHQKSLTTWLATLMDDGQGILMTASKDKSFQACEIPNLRDSLSDVSKYWQCGRSSYEETSRHFDPNMDSLFVVQPHHICCLLDMSSIDSLRHQGKRLIVSGGSGVKLWNESGDLLDQIAEIHFDKEDVKKLLRLDQCTFVGAYHTNVNVIRLSVDTMGNRHTLNTLRRLSSHHETVRILSLFNQDYQFITASLDGEILLWSESDAFSKARFNENSNYHGPSNGFPFSVQSVQVLFEKLLLVSIGNGFGVFDVESGLKVTQVMQAHVGKTSDVRYLSMSSPHGFGPNGDIIVSCGDDARILLWGLADSSLPKEESSMRTDAKNPLFLGISLPNLLKKMTDRNNKPISIVLCCYQELTGHSSNVQTLLPIDVRAHEDSEQVNNSTVTYCHGFISYAECNEVIFWRFRPLHEATCMSRICERDYHSVQRPH